MASLKKDEYETALAGAAAKLEKEAEMARAKAYALQSYIRIM